MAPPEGHYATFDADGGLAVSREALAAGGRLMQAHGAQKRKPVPSLAAVLEWKSTSAKYDAEHRWQLSSDEKELIVADLLGSRRPLGTKAIFLFCNRHLRKEIVCFRSHTAK